MFFHSQTLKEILSLKEYFIERKRNNTFDEVDSWISMVATNRLTGHSTGFFSVYSFPPNQAVSQKSQIRINKKRNQIPPYRDTFAIIMKKSKSLQSKLDSVTKTTSEKHMQAQSSFLYLRIRLLKLRIIPWLLQSLHHHFWI